MPAVLNVVNDENLNANAIQNGKFKQKKRGVLGDRTNTIKEIANLKPKADIQRKEISYSLQKPKSNDNLTHLERKYGKNKHVELNPVDIIDLHTPRYASDYVSDVVQTFKELEESPVYRVNNSYMKRQPDINGKMRELLVDWLNQVHAKFQLSGPTFYLGITLLDRFLSTTVVKRDKLQLVGCCALWIASKYEEIYAPEINDFVLISDQSYKFAEMVKAEKYIVESLRYKLGGPTSYLFLRRYLKVHGCSIRLQHIAAYLLEFIQQKIEFLKYKHSFIAASVLLFASYVEEFNVIHNKENVYGTIDSLEVNSWDDEVMERVCNQTKYDLLVEGSCVEELQTLLMRNVKSNNRAVYKKYAQEKYLAVSKLDYSFPLEVEEDETMDTNVS